MAAMINGLSKMATTALLLVMAIVPATFAVTYKVGDDNRWTDDGVNYTAWATGKTFRVGDILEFIYDASHAVDVVDKAGYDGCDSSSATEKYSDGDTKIELKTEGSKYFICPKSGHCLGGQKLAITVVAAAPGTPSTPGSPPAAGTPTPDSGSTTSPPPPAPGGNGASKGVMSYVLVGVSMVLGYGLWF